MKAKRIIVLAIGISAALTALPEEDRATILAFDQVTKIELRKGFGWRVEVLPDGSASIKYGAAYMGWRANVPQGGLSFKELYNLIAPHLKPGRYVLVQDKSGRETVIVNGMTEWRVDSSGGGHLVDTEVQRKIMHGIFDKAEVSGFREYFEGTVRECPVVPDDPPYIPVWMRTSDTEETWTAPPQPVQPPAVAATQAPLAAPEETPPRPAAEEHGGESARPPAALTALPGKERVSILAFEQVKEIKLLKNGGMGWWVDVLPDGSARVRYGVYPIDWRADVPKGNLSFKEFYDLIVPHLKPGAYGYAQDSSGRETVIVFGMMSGNRGGGYFTDTETQRKNHARNIRQGESDRLPQEIRRHGQGMAYRAGRPAVHPGMDENQRCCGSGKRTAPSRPAARCRGGADLARRTGRKTSPAR
jgi:hypothetical protein